MSFVWIAILLLLLTISNFSIPFNLRVSLIYQYTTLA
ncbi:hypothetical protein SAMN05444412_105241 [Rhodonellum ikkaensis]|uniref:Uncharacterized protein n=1 Tax=Rhodonellum ikkaensis TaxID=336829 RepID=A0A1H3Q6T7_9BACT|nr:hypothetical protein SAMN05444412_105241 [Rhodonellum ikkaensis]